jgi:hypothetical protein
VKRPKQPWKANVAELKPIAKQARGETPVFAGIDSSRHRSRFPKQGIFSQMRWLRSNTPDLEVTAP